MTLEDKCLPGRVVCNPKPERLQKQISHLQTEIESLRGERDRYKSVIERLEKQDVYLGVLYTEEAVKRKLQEQKEKDLEEFKLDLFGIVTKIRYGTRHGREGLLFPDLSKELNKYDLDD